MKKTSKFFATILAILMMISIIPISASAEENAVSYDYTVISEEEKICRLNSKQGITLTDDGTLVFPSEVDGYKVIELADGAGKASNVKKVVVPDSVEKIGKAFNGHNGLFSITLGAGVSDFEANNFVNMNCLEEFIVSEDNPYICSVDGVVFSKDMKTLLRFPTAWEDSSMYEIPDGVEIVGKAAFNQGWNSTKIEIPDSVITIEERAFSACSKIERIDMGKGVETIGESAFINCVKLANVYYASTEEDWAKISINSKGNDNLINANFHFNDKDHECEYYLSEIIPPTCIYDGYTLYVCSICGSELEDDYVEATGNHTEEIIPAVASTETTTGLTEGTKCSVCDTILVPQEIIPTLNCHEHNYEIVATTPATCTEKGSNTFACTICNDTYIEPISAFGHTKVITPAKVPTTTEAGNTRGEVCSACSEVLVQEQVIPALNEDSFATLQGDNLIGVLDKEARTLTIYGTGTIAEGHNLTSTYDKTFGTNVDYVSFVDTVIITDGVTGIGDYAFRGYPIDTFVIADSVKTIGESAFYESEVENVTMGDGVESIGDYAFRGCYYLTEIELGKSVKTIAPTSFYACENLEAIKVDSENQYFLSDENGILYNKEKTTLILCPQGSKIVSYEMPLSVKEIRTGAFYKCAYLAFVSISDCVTTIPAETFYKCENLQCVVMPESVTSIGQRAFDYWCGLQEVYFGGTEEQWNVITVESGNDSLESSTIYFEYEEFESDSGACGENLTWTYDASTATLTISGTGDMAEVSSPDEHPWRQYKNFIKKVVVSNSVTSVTYGAFSEFANLTDVEISDSVTTIGAGVFAFCDNLKTITIPDSVISIGNAVFRNCMSLTDVKLSNSIIAIADYSFTDCTSLVNITIPDSVVTIGYMAFAGCKKLENVTFGKKVTKIGEEAFDSCYAIKTLVIPDSVTTICRHAFDCCLGIETVKIGSGITTIESAAFYQCESIDIVYYAGTEEQWNTVSVGSFNTWLTGSEFVFATVEHKHNYESVVTAPTCTEQGYTTYSCECNDSYVSNYVDALGHSHTSEITTPATHTTTGVKTFTCTCGDTYTEVIEKIEKHNHESVVTTPTCTEQGYTTYTCSCGDSYVDNYVDAMGHTPADSVEENYVAPTCTANGSKDVVIYCSVCDEEISRETVTLEATGHADNDGNGYCDVDNELLDPTVECDCNCHKSGISNFFFKFILFFQRIFGSNKECACGVAHY